MKKPPTSYKASSFTWLKHTHESNTMDVAVSYVEAESCSQLSV